MIDEKEIIERLIAAIPDLKQGLCTLHFVNFSVSLYQEDILSWLNKNLPDAKYPNCIGEPYMFCWPRGNKEIRLQWLKSKLKEYEDSQL